MLAFPALLTAALCLAVVQLRAGVDPSLAIVGPLFASYLFLAVAERVIPWHRSWLHSRGDLRTDLGLFATNGALNALLLPFALAAATAASVWLSGAIGMHLWPSHWPLPAQLVVALVIAEAVEYGAHRAMHEVPWLWRFHATHHSSPRLYWLNSVRFHPIDLFFVGVGKVFPLAVLGAGGEVFALVNVFSGVHGAYQHANVPVRLGPLNWIFSMTELHRWHHSKSIEEANHNYGGNLILWDIVFGTRYLPDDRDPPEEIGIGALPDFPMGFWANLVAPFRWRALEAEANPKSS